MEVLVSMAVIGTVMTAAAPFMVKSLAESNQQRTDQVGIQVATDALERARALSPELLASGRGLAEATRQRNAAPAAVLAYYDHMEIATDTELLNTSTDGQNAPLPTRPFSVESNGVTYQQEWYVGQCWQSKATASTTSVTEAVPLSGCEKQDTPAKKALYTVPFIWVVASISWPGNSCADKTCRYIASTLVSAGTDPVFDLKSPAPTIFDPVPMTSYTDAAVQLQVVATGGTLPLTWSVTAGLPPGVTISATDGTFTGTPTTPGVYKLTVKVVDRDKRADTSKFTWTIVAPPLLTTPGDQVSRTGTVVSLQPVVTGGTSPMVWTATNLPAGLAINATTGLITGTPTTAKAAVTTTVTVTDPTLRKSTVSFSWRVLTPVQLYTVGPQTMTNGTNIGTFTPYAYGGLTPYTWQATGLPDGATMNPSTGAVTGVITHGTRYITTVTVTDAAGGVATMVVVCTVNPSGTTDLRVTSPSPSSPDRTSVSGTKLTSFTATALGASTPYTWTATNLPPGVTMTTAGVVSGTPTTKGTYVVTFIVKSTGTTQANLMFTWSVT